MDTKMKNNKKTIKEIMIRLYENQDEDIIEKLEKLKKISHYKSSSRAIKEYLRVNL